MFSVKLVIDKVVVNFMIYLLFKFQVHSLSSLDVMALQSQVLKSVLLCLLSSSSRTLRNS